MVIAICVNLKYQDYTEIHKSGRETYKIRHRQLLHVKKATTRLSFLFQTAFSNHRIFVNV